MSEIALLIDDLRSSSAISVCRICHEEEFESCKSLEAPCACSGTVKFAHRDCVQRWCDEKGNTTCEICLQKFEPGYTCMTKKTQLIHTTVFVRESLAVPIIEQEVILETENFECASAADRSAACCRSVALVFTALLLIRHLFAVLTDEEGPYPFSLATVYIVKACGIVLPMYVLIWVIAALYSGIRYHHGVEDTDSDMSSDDESEDENENEILA